MEKIKTYNPYGKDFALLVLRIGLGVIFMWHGWDKLQHVETMTGFFGSLGLAPFWFWAVALTEFVGGIFILLGIFVPIASLGLLVVMLVAIFMVKFKALESKGFSFVEIDIALLCMSAALLMAGAGKFSLGRLFCPCCKKGKCKTTGVCACHIACGGNGCLQKMCMCDCDCVKEEAKKIG